MLVRDSVTQALISDGTQFHGLKNQLKKHLYLSVTLFLVDCLKE